MCQLFMYAVLVAIGRVVRRGQPLATESGWAQEDWHRLQTAIDWLSIFNRCSRLHASLVADVALLLFNTCWFGDTQCLWRQGC